MTQDTPSRSPEASASRLTDLVSETAAQRAATPMLPAAAWVKIAILAGAFIALTGWQYKRMAITWIHDSNWTHGFVIPLFSLFLIYQRRHELLSAERRGPNVFGLIFMLGGIGMMFGMYAVLGFEYGARLAIPVILLGLVWFLTGNRIAVLTWLPIFYLVFAFPISDFLYERISVPLQNLAAKASALALTVAGVKIDVSQSHLTIISVSGKVHPLTVAEACSGIRSLMAFAALGVAWAYVVERPLWQRVVLVLCIVPVAVFCNLIRVTITSSMFALDHPELGKEFMHTFLGMLMLIPAAGIFWLISWVLGALFVEEPEDGHETDTSLAAQAEGR